MLPEQCGKILHRSLVPLAIRLSSCAGSKGGKSDSKCSTKSNSKPEPSCKRSAKKKSCSKVPTPFPSYSECKRKPTDPKPSKECDCWDFDKC